MSNETPSEGSLSIEAILAALVDIAFQEGRFELARATGRRGVMNLNVRLVLGDHGKPLESTSSLVFESKRHVKDGFHRERPNG